MSLVFGKSFGFLRQCSRKFCTSGVKTGVESFEFQGRVFNKLLSNNIERKIRNAGARPSFKVLDHKRRAALSMMYMVNICEALTLGDFPEVLEKGINITRVSVKDTSVVEAFWLAENEDKVEVQKLLSSIAGKVASKLMYANMLGHVPHIQFKQDLSAINVEETKKLLDKVALQNSLLKKNEETLQDNIALSQNNLETLESPLPPMSTRVLGLPHDRIYKRIQDAKRKCYPIQITAPPTTEEFEKSQQKIEISTKSVKNSFDRKKTLKKFIALYQKSALRSGSRPEHQRYAPISREQFYEEEEEDDTYSALSENIKEQIYESEYTFDSRLEGTSREEEILNEKVEKDRT